MWLDIPLVSVTKHWLAQSALYMNAVERLHRWMLEAGVFLLLFWLLDLVLDRLPAVAAAFVVAHSLNAVFNGQIVALLVHDNPRMNRYRDPDKFVEYIAGIQRRLTRKSPACVREVLIFGSLTQGVFRETSDLDIRFIAADGFWNALRATHYVFVERVIAGLKWFPLDAYMFRSQEETERKTRVREEPAVCLYRRDPTKPSIMDNVTSFEHLKRIMADARATRKPLRVIVIGGSEQLLEALLATRNVPMRRLFATNKLSSTVESLKGERSYFLISPKGNLLKYLINALQSIWLVLCERPHAVISTGGGISIATSLLSKLFGAKLIYIEPGTRARTPSRTGQLLYRFADLFIVQWEPLTRRFPKAVLGGPLL